MVLLMIQMKYDDTDEIFSVGRTPCLLIFSLTGLRLKITFAKKYHGLEQNLRRYQFDRWSMYIYHIYMCTGRQ